MKSILQFRYNTMLLSILYLCPSDPRADLLLLNLYPKQHWSYHLFQILSYFILYFMKSVLWDSSYSDTILVFFSLVITLSSLLAVHPCFPNGRMSSFLMAEYVHIRHLLYPFILMSTYIIYLAMDNNAAIKDTREAMCLFEVLFSSPLGL